MADEENPTKKKVGVASVLGAAVTGGAVAYGTGHGANNRAKARLAKHKEDMEAMVEQREVAEKKAIEQFELDHPKPGTQRAEELRRESGNGSVHVETRTEQEMAEAVAKWEAKRAEAIAKALHPFEARPTEITAKHFATPERMAQAEASTAKYAESSFLKKPVVGFMGASGRSRVAMGAALGLSVLGAGYLLRHTVPNDAPYTERVSATTQDNGASR